MVVVLEVRNRDGVIGRCDARCQGAASRRCRCVCGGCNHGVGLNAAVGNWRECFEWYVELACGRRCGVDLVVAQGTDQTVLFE